MSAQSDLWTDAYLDSMRQVGDPDADQAIAAVFAESNQQAQSVLNVIESLVRNTTPTPENLPAALHGYLDMTSRVPPPVLPRIKLGEDAFAEHGPEVLCLLACYSLPAAYGARRGAQVLVRTGQLTQRTHQRLMVTSQMVLDVMGPGGLAPGGRGIRTAQKVRLMHAAIRHLLVHNTRAPWDLADLGLPINQEDLAGTLMTFSWQIMDGLAKLGLPLAAEEQEAYLDSWKAVGHLMGVHPTLIPHTIADAKILTDTIERRQIAASAEGKQLAQALLQMMDHASPRFAHGIPPAIMRELLPVTVSDFLGIPQSTVHKWVVRSMIGVARLIDKFTARRQDRTVVFRFLTIHLLQWMVTLNLGRPARFEIPLELSTLWNVPPAPPGDGVPVPTPTEVKT
jgi:hypothetical protein